MLLGGDFFCPGIFGESHFFGIVRRKIIVAVIVNKNKQYRTHVLLTPASESRFV